MCIPEYSQQLETYSSGSYIYEDMYEYIFLQSNSIDYFL